ncbi:MAG TPA: CcoQ/FixQ family Cbb3-type cytochrome c oxidase assembly chaperone [Longimicrobiales bacterium]|nr:CcoQ/FixQ family Cbb3-type cytochrome c oxidase assembly chaperone [Longimicrobiales bacterium]
MNPVYRDAAGYVQNAWIMGAMTVLFVACFVGWTWWAYKGSNRARFEDAARLPLTTGDDA